MKEPLAIPLYAAAELLSLKDARTIKKYGKEGRVRIVGSGNGQRVLLSSIHDYLRGESEWHANQQSQPGENQAPARSATRRAGNSRMKRRIPLDTDSTDTITLRRDRTLQRI
jgi:hypothetical protein